jgi:uncharacterized protein YdhG (YjbR/CyaY superfamily)
VSLQPLDRGETPVETDEVSRDEVDAYLAALEEPRQSTLRALRHTILAIIPEAEQCISYAMPTFKVRGKAIAGFAAFKNHLSYFPHSGSVIPELWSELAQYKASKGTLQFPVGQPLPKAIVEKLVAVRMRQAFGESRPGGQVD